jgi:hypothetical protein
MPPSSHAGHTPATGSVTSAPPTAHRAAPSGNRKRKQGAATAQEMSNTSTPAPSVQGADHQGRNSAPEGGIQRDVQRTEHPRARNRSAKVPGYSREFVWDEGCGSFVPIEYTGPDDGSSASRDPQEASEEGDTLARDMMITSHADTLVAPSPQQTLFPEPSTGNTITGQAPSPANLSFSPPYWLETRDHTAEDSPSAQPAQSQDTQAQSSLGYQIEGQAGDEESEYPSAGTGQSFAGSWFGQNE